MSNRARVQSDRRSAASETTDTVFVGLDHVQIAVPPGSEDRARAFYAGVVGMREIPKPPKLAVRGGAWFEFGTGQLHVGIEEAFVPAKKAHPAIALCDDPALEAIAERLRAAGHEVRWSDEVPGTRRFHTDDPFGNRLEFLAAAR